MFCILAISHTHTHTERVLSGCRTPRTVRLLPGVASLRTIAVHTGCQHRGHSSARADSTKRALNHSCTQVCLSLPCHTFTEVLIFVRFPKIAGGKKTNIRSVGLSVRMEELDSHRKDFDEIRYLRIFFENLLRKFKFH